jgi:aryl-alcohol dehydrogenase-like predicted oxidoreductase
VSGALPTRTLGSLAVPAMGYGAMVLAGAYVRADDGDASRALAAAVDAGCTFVDTSDSYGANERQIGAFLAARRRDEIQISTKFGLRVPGGEPTHRLPVPYGVGAFQINGEPRLVRGYLEASLRRLGTDYVDVYSPHFPDPDVPIEDTVGSMAPLVDAGMVRHLGLSNPTLDDLVRTQAVHRIAAVQVEWSMWHPLEPGLLEHCERTGVGIVAWSPVGRGFLTGTLEAVEDGDFRTSVERLRESNLAANNARFAPVRALAADLGLTPAQLALAWLLHRSPAVVPIPGSRTPAHIAQNAAAVTVTLDADARARIDAALAAFVPAGTVS